MTEQPRIRNLPKDQDNIILPFETRRGRYNIIRPGDALGIQRWTELEKMKIVFGVGRTVGGILESLQNIETLLADDKPFKEIRREAILAVNSLRRGIIDTSKERFNYALYLSTLFVYREGHDPLKWDIRTAESYIEDWAEEGLSELDFFSFALVVSSELREPIRRLQQEEEARQAVLSAYTS